jgi:hypothetical protein
MHDEKGGYTHVVPGHLSTVGRTTEWLESVCRMSQYDGIDMSFFVDPLRLCA